MKLRKIVTHPIFIIIISLLSSGTFMLFGVIYFTVVLGTYKSILNKKIASIITIGTIYMIIRVYGENNDYSLAGIFVAISEGLAMVSIVALLVMWFLVPYRLVELRESVGLKPLISWKIGLIPLLACFYTFGFFAIHAPSRDYSRELTMGIGVPLIISCAIAMTYWLFVVHARFNEYMDKYDEIDQEYRRRQYIKRQKRKRRGKSLPQMTKPLHEEDLPPIDLQGYSADTNVETEVEFLNDIDFESN